MRERGGRGGEGRERGGGERRERDGGRIECRQHRRNSPLGHLVFNSINIIPKVSRL